MFLLCTHEDVDDEGETKETKSHFDFGLFGNLNGSEYVVMRAKSLQLHILEKN